MVYNSQPASFHVPQRNTNTLASNLNARVIQMVIAKNLTLAQAWGILDLARTQNGTSNVTAFPFFATSEFYALASGAHDRFAQTVVVSSLRS